MDTITGLLILVGLGCLIMGFVLLSQDYESQDKEKHERHEEQKQDTKHKPITRPSDRIWMQDTREQSEQVRPYPVF